MTPKKKDLASIAYSFERTSLETKLSSSLTTQERLQRIETLGRRIDEYVAFICALGNPNASSAEAKEKFVVAFYEQLVRAEHQLKRIHEQFRLE